MQFQDLLSPWHQSCRSQGTSIVFHKGVHTLGNNKFRRWDSQSIVSRDNGRTMLHCWMIGMSAYVITHWLESLAERNAPATHWWVLHLVQLWRREYSVKIWDKSLWKYECTFDNFKGSSEEKINSVKLRSNVLYYHHSPVIHSVPFDYLTRICYFWVEPVI